MHAFHGTTMSDAAAIMARPVVNQFPGLWVTDTADRAARYANARATSEVDFDATVLQPHAAVIELEVDEVAWSVRGNNMIAATATSLDQVEGLIRENTKLRIVSVKIAECDRVRCKCHVHARACSGEVAVAREMAAEHTKLYGPSRDFDYLK